MTIVSKQLARSAALPALMGAAALIAPATGFAQQQAQTYGAASAPTAAPAASGDYRTMHAPRYGNTGQATTQSAAPTSTGQVIYNNGPGLQNAQGNEIGSSIPGVYGNRSGISGPQAYGAGGHGITAAQAYGGAAAGQNRTQVYRNGPYTYTRPAQGTGGAVNPALGSGTPATGATAGTQYGPRGARTAPGAAAAANTVYSGSGTGGPAVGATGSAGAQSGYSPQAAPQQNATLYGPLHGNATGSRTNANTGQVAPSNYSGYYRFNGTNTTGPQTMNTPRTGNGTQQTYLYGRNSR